MLAKVKCPTPTTTLKDIVLTCWMSYTHADFIDLTARFTDAEQILPPSAFTCLPFAPWKNNGAIRWGHGVQADHSQRAEALRLGSPHVEGSRKVI